jgi:protein-disulfide isomerase
MRLLLGLLLVWVAVAGAQQQQGTPDWQTATILPNVDLAGLSAAQKQAALKALRAQSCTCGCDMHVAECRMKDPSCGESRALADIIIQAVKAGKDPQKAVAESDFIKRKSATPALLEEAVALPVSGAPVKGPAGARIALVEFSDFECPYCSRAVPKIDAILKAYPNDAKLIYKQFPLPNHPHARMAAQAAVAAQSQDKFWPMYDKLFANFNKLSEATVVALAKESGLDMARFEAERNSAKAKAVVDRDIADGTKVQIAGTPTLFINGKRYNGPLDMTVLKPILDAELKK